MKAICQNCGKEFEIKYPRNPNKFCSKSCAGQYYGAQKIKNLGTWAIKGKSPKIKEFKEDVRVLSYLLGATGNRCLSEHNYEYVVEIGAASKRFVKEVHDAFRRIGLVSWLWYRKDLNQWRTKVSSLRLYEWLRQMQDLRRLDKFPVSYTHLRAHET